MSITYAQIQKLRLSDCLFSLTVLVYPKILLFENLHTFRITNIEDKSVNCHDLESEVIDQKVQGNFVWLLLKNNEILVIDVINDLQLKIVADASFEIRHLAILSNTAIIIMEHGDCFGLNITLEELEHNFREGIKERKVSYERCSYIKPSEYKFCCAQSINGLNIYPEAGYLVNTCPITGLSHIICSSTSILHMIIWDNCVVLSSNHNIYIVDLNNENINWKVESSEMVNYYPISVHNNALYYLTWNKNELDICYAWKVTPSLEEHHENSLQVYTAQIAQETLKSQVKDFISDMLLKNETGQSIPQLLALIEKIEDYSFLINTVSLLCQNSLLYKSLLYSLQTRIFASKDKIIIDQLSDVMIKVDLLEYIIFRENYHYNEINLFDKTFIQLCVLFISKSDLDLASICWLKYYHIFRQSITSEHILEILEAMPQNVKMGALIIWLKSFASTLLDDNPYYSDLIVRWTSERVFQMEHSPYWPKIGLKFIREVVNVLKTSLTTIYVRPVSMDDLDVLEDHITTVIELKENYKINILLEELSSKQPSEVAFLMLRRCYTEDLEGFLHNYLPFYAAKNVFVLDEILHLFMESDAASSGGGVDSNRLQILLNGFRSPSIRLECLLQILKVLDVPWNPIVLNIAIKAAASASKDFTVTDSDRTLALEIEKEIYYAKVKVLLKKYNFSLSCTDYNLLLLKVINAQKVDLDDLKVVTSVMPVYNNYGNLVYIDRCLKDCETKEALDYLKGLPNKEKEITLKAVQVKYEQVLNGNSNIGIEKNYLDFLKGSRLLNEIEVTALENLYQLKNGYNISFTLSNLYNEDICNSKVASCVSEDLSCVSSGRGECLVKLTCTYQSQRSQIIALLRRSSTSHNVRKLIENFIMDADTTESVMSTLNNFIDGQNSNILIDCVNLLVELLTNCIEEHIHYLIQFLSILNSLINCHTVLKNLSVTWKFQYIYLPMSSVSSMNDIIEFQNHKGTNEELELHIRNIFNRSDLIPLNLVANVMAYYTYNEKSVPIEIIKLRNRVAKKLLSKIIVLQELDEILLTDLLIILNKWESIDDELWILEILKGQNESLSPHIMSYLSKPNIRRTFGLNEILPDNIVSYPPQYILKTKFNINFSEISLPDNMEETWDDKVILFYVLKQFPETSSDRLIDICRTLNVALNDGLSLQLISLLTTWELKYKIKHDDLECQYLHMVNDENELMDRCLLLWESIESKKFITDILNDFWQNGDVTLHGRLVTINPYYYEVFICIYHLIFKTSGESRNIKGYFLLNFLKDYNRKSTPKQYEFELFSVKGMFPEIGHYRLPFHLFMREDMWSNLKSEITLETYKRWLPVVAILSLDADLQTARDMICSNALKQTMTSRKRNDENLVSKENEPWRLIAGEEPLLRAAHRCIRHIANMEWAGACLFYVLQGCARGADQVAAAQLCFQFAQKWAALQPGNRAVRQMERLHSTLSTRHALQKIEWACEEFVRLSSEPTQLIRALYLHPSFVEKMTRHDVNRAANEIADKNGINISSIRFQILENILNKSADDLKTHSSMSLTIKDLMTAKYILKATCPKMGAIYLSRIAFDSENDYNKFKKLRALQCLMSVVDTDTAIKFTNREREELWVGLIELLCVLSLEHIDMPWIAATFVQDKNRALEQLLTSVGGNIEGLKISAEICSIHGNEQMIRNIIPLLSQASLFEEIIPLLLKLSSPPDELIVKTWRSIILSPFKKADYPITEKQREKCLKVINLLPLCPIISDTDLIEVWNNCVRCKSFGLGCLVLPYMTPEARFQLKELQKIDRRNLIASLKNLHTETYLLSGAMHVIENLSKSRK